MRASFAVSAELAGVELVVDARPHNHYVVEGTDSALRRAVAGLVDNALADVTRGGRVAIELRADRREVTLTVIDDGEGHDPARALELTERFRRGSQEQVDDIRLGLGLSLVNEIVAAHSGAMPIDGAPGKGAAFTLRFPASDGQLLPSEPGTAQGGNRQDEPAT